MSLGVNKMVDTINLFVLESTKQWIQQIYFCWSQQNGESHNFIFSGFNKMVDPMNLFLLKSINSGWIPEIHFYWSPKNHKFISAVTTIFLQCFYSTGMSHFDKEGLEGAVMKL